MRYTEDDGELFYYDEFIDLKNIFDWIFNIEDILEDKHEIGITMVDKLISNMNSNGRDKIRTCIT